MTPNATDRDFAFQEALLQRVSRTYAMTIPALPEPVRRAAVTAYLLCRIADTIEDEPALSLQEKRIFLQRFGEVVAGTADAAAFATDLGASLSAATPRAERDTVAASAMLVGIVNEHSPRVRRAIERCIRIMTEGMIEFQQKAAPDGVDDMLVLKRYCYVVAGVVGELMAEIFCDHASDIDSRGPALRAHAIPFGRGLQMTNIIKDIHADRRRGVCWLPRSVFEAAGFDLKDFRADGRALADPGFAKGLAEVAAAAQRDLALALRFTQIIPPRHAGLRRYLLWTLGLSVLMLRRIHTRPATLVDGNVRPPRWHVYMLVALIRILARHNGALTWLFRAAIAGASRPGAVSL